MRAVALEHLMDDARVYSIEVSREFVELVAKRVVELQLEHQDVTHARAHGLLMVSEVAERLRVHPKWVYAHQNRLGAIRLGAGPKARLRFPVADIDAALENDELSLTATSGTQESSQTRPRRRRRLRSRPVPPIELSRDGRTMPDRGTD